jgi:murein DD-endopeptidase MepM/ murein hydrolase activator NlpD
MALSAEQRRNARTIISVGRSLGASSRDILIALMTAMQESSLRNLKYGHLDSVGLFQQRAGWGSFSQRTNPAFAARMFFTGGVRGPGTPGLLDIRNRNSMRLTSAAQAVQRSAFPNAYARHEGVARGLLGSAGTGASTSAGFLRPVRGGTFSSGFGPRRGSAGISKNHHGLDIAVPVKTPVYAAASGRVVRVTSGGNYGLRIEIAHEGKLWTLYAHLSSASVRVGQQVMQGQRIGLSGGRRGAPNAGNSTGPHLHFEVRVGSNAYNAARDPEGFLNGRTTPNAYVDLGTTVVQPDMSQLQEQMDQLDIQMQPPYVYQNPIEFALGDTVPLNEDPLTTFGAGTSMSEPPTLEGTVGGSRTTSEPEMDKLLHEGTLV